MASNMKRKKKSSEKIISDMAQGNLQFDLSYKNTDELGHLADQMRHMGQNLLDYIYV